MNALEDLDLDGFVAALKARAVPTVREPLRVEYTTARTGLAGANVSVATIHGRCERGCVSGIVHETGRSCECMKLREFAGRWTRAKLPPEAVGLKAAWRPLAAPWGRFEATARQVVASRRGPMFYGAQGRGKTYQALAIAVSLVEQGTSVRWVSWPALRETLISAMGAERNGAPTRTDIIVPLAAAPVLILDDLGVGKMGEWAEEIGYSLVDRRAAEKLPVVGTMNLDPAAAERYLGQRVWGRLTAVCGATECVGHSWRTT